MRFLINDFMFPCATVNDAATKSVIYIFNVELFLYQVSKQYMHIVVLYELICIYFSIWWWPFLKIAAILEILFVFLSLL